MLERAGLVAPKHSVCWRVPGFPPWEGVERLREGLHSRSVTLQPMTACFGGSRTPTCGKFNSRGFRGTQLP